MQARPKAALSSVIDGVSEGRAKSALVLIDFINPLDFENADAMHEAALDAAIATRALKRVANQKGHCVIYANDHYGAWQSQFQDVFAHCRAQKGVPREICQFLAPEPQDIIILKPRHSAFYATPLELVLAQTRVHRLILTGIATDICVQLSAMDAYLRGYDVWVPSDCTAAESAKRKTDALTYMQRVLKCNVRPAIDSAQGRAVTTEVRR